MTTRNIFYGNRKCAVIDGSLVSLRPPSSLPNGICNLSGVQQVKQRQPCNARILFMLTKALVILEMYVRTHRFLPVSRRSGGSRDHFFGDFFRRALVLSLRSKIVPTLPEVPAWCAHKLVDVFLRSAFAALLKLGFIGIQQSN